MKILLACQQSLRDHPVPAYKFWRTYFLGGLREAGHEVIEVPGADWAYGLVSQSARSRSLWRDETWSRTLACVKEGPRPDLFLSYLYPAQIEPAAMRELRSFGLPAVNFFCDNVREYRHLPAAFSSFDLHWVPEYEAMPKYAARKWSAIFAPMPCWIPPGQRSTPETEPASVCFIGRRDPLRAGLLEQLAHSGLPLRVRGEGWAGSHEVARVAPRHASWGERIADWTDFWRRQGLGPVMQRLHGNRHPTCASFDFTPWSGPLPDDEAYASALAQSTVTLGINRYADFSGQGAAAATYSRLRDIEAPMAGACYLTEWAPELPTLYEVGREIEVYRNSDELIAIARDLLASPARRLALRQAGQHRALADHSVGRTIERIRVTLGLSS